jgi:hypothetical protein
MTDCLWFAIGVCNGGCKCEKYLSMNSDRGQEVGEKWEIRVDEVLTPIAKEFAKENGFKGDE